MTAEKLYGILAFLDTLDSKLKLQTHLEAIGSAVTNLAGSPAQPDYQNSLASALSSFETAVSQMRASISPSQMTAIKAMGGEDFFDPSIAQKVKESVQLNAMTPAVARDFVMGLVGRRAEFLKTVRSAKKGLQDLKVQELQMEEGSADIAFLIPREIFDNELGPFARELKFLDRLMGHYSEAVMSEVQPAKLEQLSSSMPTVAVLAAVPVIAVLAKVVNLFLNAWEKIEKIRKMRAELQEMGLKVSALNELTDRVTTTVDEVVEQSVELVVANYKGARKSELENGVRADTRRLFGQIERGLSVEFRVKPGPANEEDEKQKMLGDIQTVAAQIKFPDVPREPMLLPSGDVVGADDEVEVHTVREIKKTKSHKTTVSKKEKEANGAEPAG